MTRFSKWMAAPVAVLALATDASAGTDTSTLAVKVQVIDTCEIQGGTLDFGTYESGQDAPLLGEGTIAFANCSVSQVTIEMDGGSGGDVAARRMDNGAGGNLNYQIYRNFDRTFPWGVGEQKLTRTILAGTGTFPVFGTIPGGQKVTPGTYNDVLNVTLTF